MPNLVHQTELKAVTTATFTTEVVDGFQVLRSASVADTFRLYAAITHRLAVRPPSCPLPQLGSSRVCPAIARYQQHPPCRGTVLLLP